MATSPVNVWNLALAGIGSTVVIGDPTENSKEARQCRLAWDLVLNTCLESTDWPFARRRANLALIEADPSIEWPYRYALPDDCAAARYIEPCGRLSMLPPTALIPFMVEGSQDGKNPTLVTDIPEAVLVYTTRKQGVGTYPAVFTKLLVAELAAALAMPLTQKLELARATAELAQIALLKARAAKFSEQSFDRVELPSSIELARR